MTQYVSEYYSRTVLVTNDIELVKNRADELIKKFSDREKKFIDPDFGPTTKDPKGELAIFYPSDEEVGIQGDASVGQYNNVAGLNINMISWLRPKDFCKDPKKCAFITQEESDDESPNKKPSKSKPKKAQGGASSLDVMQGNLGDCWFISAMALIAIRDDLFNQITCNGAFKSYEPKGLYVFKMHKNCRPHYIIVDDRIPCLEKSRGDYIPAFARCRNPNEFWVSLLEKAYAKLNIRYINLTSGFIDEALQDLTGLAPEMQRFTSSVEVDDFWDTLKTHLYTNSLIGASLNFLGRRDYPEDDKKELQREAKMLGIQYGHAYGILDVREVTMKEETEEKTYRMLRVKNPWGKDNNMEWNGDWGDNDPRWNPENIKRYNDAAAEIPSKLDREELVHQPGRNDNIFVIPIEEFVKYFNTLMAVRDFPDEWSGVRYYSRWEPSYGLPPKSPRWADNPNFQFTLTKSTELSIKLQQPDPRCFADARPPMRKQVLMILVFKNPGQALKQFSSTNIALQSSAADSRAVSAEGELSAGSYIISIFTASEGVNSECYLSVYFNCKKNEIEFSNTTWEVILEEEEENTSRPRGAKIKSIEKKKEIVEDIVIESHETKDDLETVIKDLAALELETEINMCYLLGVAYEDYKLFQELSKEKQERIALEYKIPAGVMDLNDYCLGVRGVFTLLDIITSENTLEVIKLRNNQINDKVVLELCRRLKKFNKLREIDLSHNVDITDKGGAALLYLAGKITSIIKIDISGTSVSLDVAYNILSRVNRVD
jgi:Calpain family cysteine protease